jgi:hypothetical protein
VRILHVSHTLGSTGRENSKPNIGSHSHTGDTRPGQTRKTPKDLCEHESEEHGRGESVGWYAVYIVYNCLLLIDKARADDKTYIFCERLSEEGFFFFARLFRLRWKSWRRAHQDGCC